MRISRVPVEINEEIFYIKEDLDIIMENGQSSSSDASTTELTVDKDKDEEDTNLESNSPGSESVPKKEESCWPAKAQGKLYSGSFERT
ncbi:hypothetical protein CHS0354_025578 [Potamilus streckersoni]|uniref:Uncharacterized protein n=1 Tax=Potamilus streckersoni TaxID=2493646 RepID=A0AAE0S157_9BIVA|nr:hypothetical protein CHS0354_025578 [Potamilus streckersoni]